jgi:hypothetical protein
MMSATKNFNNVDSYKAIGAAKDNLNRIRRRLRRSDDALWADLNQRLGELDKVVYHLREVAFLLASAREMRRGD